MRKKTNITAVGSALCLLAIATAFGKNAVAEEAGRFASRVAALRSAVEDLIGTFADRYPDGPKFLAQLDEVDEKGFEKLQREALLALYGIGPASVWYILFDVFHHLDKMDHISPWEQKIYSKLFFDREPDDPVGVDELLKTFERFGKYEMLAVHYIWEDLFWRRKYEPVAWLEKLIRL